MDDFTFDTIVAPLIWTCDICHDPVGDEDGWLTVNERLAWQLKEQWERIETLKDSDTGLIPFDAIDTWPPRHVTWHVYHIDCDPDLENKWDYWFSVDRIRTFHHVLAWNKHLNDKPWIRYTDWTDMLCRRLGDGVSIV